MFCPYDKQISVQIYCKFKLRKNAYAATVGDINMNLNNEQHNKIPKKYILSWAKDFIKAIVSCFFLLHSSLFTQ